MRSRSNYDIRGRPFFPVLRQGQTGTTGVLSATTSATTVENEYIPYWPGGEWAMHRDPGYQKYCPEIVMKFLSGSSTALSEHGRVVGHAHGTCTVGATTTCSSRSSRAQLVGQTYLPSSC
ncbi:hypothetical protein MSG28_015284 [Choristoneura fumiferana]|uniref:Uncharacterized protein n=1 Tax=Choristoneura fumiferana TaxID=7141 RepID=A0ACC0K9N8_CHOFU|nr:hypothetical protein MSG28_015284 [Choristoneura fumiferana]